MQDLFNELFDFNDYRYFYHITGHGVGESIIENGLLMAEKNTIQQWLKLHLT